jgi:hypothetical protein
MSRRRSTAALGRQLDRHPRRSAVTPQVRAPSKQRACIAASATWNLLHAGLPRTRSRSPPTRVAGCRAPALLTDGRLPTARRASAQPTARASVLPNSQRVLVRCPPAVASPRSSLTRGTCENVFAPPRRRSSTALMPRRWTRTLCEGVPAPRRGRREELDVGCGLWPRPPVDPDRRQAEPIAARRREEVHRRARPEIGLARSSNTCQCRCQAGTEPISTRRSRGRTDADQHEDGLDVVAVGVGGSRPRPAALPRVLEAARPGTATCRHTTRAVQPPAGCSEVKPSSSGEPGECDREHVAGKLPRLSRCTCGSSSWYSAGAPARSVPNSRSSSGRCRRSSRSACRSSRMRPAPISLRSWLTRRTTAGTTLLKRGAEPRDRAEAHHRRLDDDRARLSQEGAVVPKHSHHNEQITATS